MTLRPYSADLQKAFRDLLGTPGAPETVDDSAPIIPVAVVASSPDTVRYLSGQTTTSTVTNRTDTYTVPSGKSWTIRNVVMSRAVAGLTDFTLTLGGTTYVLDSITAAGIFARLSITQPITLKQGDSIVVTCYAAGVGAITTAILYEEFVGSS